MRSGVGVFCPTGFDGFLDFADLPFFFFEEVFAEVCADAGRPAPYARRAALNMSTAPRKDRKDLFFIGLMSNAPSRLLLRSWNYASQVHRIELIVACSPLDLEQDILSLLQPGNKAAVLCHRTD